MQMAEEPTSSIRDATIGITIDGFGGDKLTALAATGQPFFEFAEGSWVRPGTTGPIVRFQIICRDGYPEIDEVRIIRSEGDPEISATTLQAIPLKNIKEDAIGMLALMAYGAQHHIIDDSDIKLHRAGLNAAGPTAIAASRRRRIVTDELLQEVAGVYGADTTGKPTQAVADHFYTGHRNATRWVRLARDRKFLPDIIREDQS